MGGRGTYVAQVFAKVGEEDNAQIVAVCDVYQKRVNENKAKHKCDGYLDYREVLARKDIDAVIIATPDHWHAHIALDAMAKGKDVYLEKPMCHTIDEARQLVDDGEGRPSASCRWVRRPPRRSSGGRPRRPSPTAPSAR